MRKSNILMGWLIGLGLLFGAAQGVPVAHASDEEPVGSPPRLSLLEGQVSFHRPGAEDWIQAQVNIPLSPGDYLFAGPDSRMEIQIGAQAFVRGGADTQIGVAQQGRDFLQLKVITGQVSLDLHTLAAGQTVEINTPNAAFAIDTQGYYRLDVSDDRTEFITRRTGRAMAILDNGDTLAIGQNEAVTLQGTAHTSISSRTAPAIDAFDRWNYARTQQRSPDQESSRYIAADTYGIGDLDRYGTWRTVPTYGPVWMPRGVSADWVPYSTGAWMHDPYYGWTWVDTAPWGWAPYHYGRWVHFNGYWCWAPGPRIQRPRYAPALVAFFGHTGSHVSIGVGGPVVGWVSLGWGEPLIPWWGRPGFIHKPWWGGWAGPRMINNRAIRSTRVVNVTEIHLYRNTRVRRSMVVVGKDHFGHGPITHARIRQAETRQLRPIHTAPRSSAGFVSRVPSTHRGVRPPEAYLKRNVVTADRYRGKPMPATVLPGGGNSRPGRGIAPRLSLPEDRRGTPIRQIPGIAPSPPINQLPGMRSGDQGPRQRGGPAPPVTGPAVRQPRQPSPANRPEAVSPLAPKQPMREINRPEPEARPDRRQTRQPSPADRPEAVSPLAPRQPMREINRPEPEARPDQRQSRQPSPADRPEAVSPLAPRQPMREINRSDREARPDHRQPQPRQGDSRNDHRGR